MFNKFVMKILILLIITISGLSVFNGCIGVQTHLKAIEPYARPITADYKVIKEMESEVSAFRLLWFLPVTVQPDIQIAIDSEILKAKGDNIIDLRLWHERQYWLMGTVDVTTIQGKVIRYIDNVDDDYPMKKDARVKYDIKFRAMVALEAIKGEKTTAEIASEYKVRPELVEKWKKQALSGLTE